MDAYTQSIQPGSSVVLVEEGGAAICTVTVRSDSPDWVKFTIQFSKILIQYPFVPYFEGDVIEVGYNPNPTYADMHSVCWRFDPVKDWEQ